MLNFRGRMKMAIECLQRYDNKDQVPPSEVETLWKCKKIIKYVFMHIIIFYVHNNKSLRLEPLYSIEDPKLIWPSNKWPPINFLALFWIGSDPPPPQILEFFYWKKWLPGVTFVGFSIKNGFFFENL